MLKYIKGFAWLLAFSMLISLVSAAVKVQLPIVVQYSVDVLIGGAVSDNPLLSKYVTTLGAAFLMIVVIRCGESILRYFSGVFKNIAVENIGERLRNRLYSQVQSFSYATHGKHQSGELVQRCTSDVETYLEFYRTQVDEVGRLAVMMIMSIVIMLGMNWKLALISIGIMPIVAFISITFHGRISKQFETVDEQEAKLTAVAQESMSGIRVVRAFGMERYEIDRFGEVNTRYFSMLRDLGKHFSAYFSITDFLSIGQLAATLIVGGLFVINGDMTVGTLMAFLMYSEWLSWPLKQLARIVTRMGKAFVSAKRIGDILDTPVDEEDGTLCPEISGSIVFDNVSFAYEDDKKVLSGISFEIGAGKTLGILGHTGSGKSTLVMLLQRLMEYEGSIKIDGVELRDIRKDYIRSKVGLVLQDTYLFSKTVMENINILGNHSKDEVYKAAMISDIHNNISSFAQGYDTVVGEKGAQLSGGQKQRVSISRTIIEDKKVLIFDDSLSAVDAETDMNIREALDSSMGSVTRIIISHRINTVMGADKIIVLREGVIEEMGTHERLAAAGGLYQKLWEIQTSED